MVLYGIPWELSRVPWVPMGNNGNVTLGLWVPKFPNFPRVGNLPWGSMASCRLRRAICHGSNGVPSEVVASRGFLWDSTVTPAQIIMGL